MTTEWYRLERVTYQPPAAGAFSLRTAAVRCCDLCSEMIDGMGDSPGEGSICIACGDELKRGALRGAVIRDEDNVNVTKAEPEA